MKKIFTVENLIKKFLKTLLILAMAILVLGGLIMIDFSSLDKIKESKTETKEEKILTKEGKFTTIEAVNQ